MKQWDWVHECSISGEVAINMSLGGHLSQYVIIIIEFDFPIIADSLGAQYEVWPMYWDVVVAILFAFSRFSLN